MVHMCLSPLLSLTMLMDYVQSRQNILYILRKMPLFHPDCYYWLHYVEYNQK